MVRITDKAFQYTPSFATDLKKRFRKMELERKRAQVAAQKPVESVVDSNSIISISRHSAAKI